MQATIESTTIKFPSLSVEVDNKQSFLTVNAGDTTEALRLRISNIDVVTIFDEVLNNLSIVDISGFMPGIYFVHTVIDYRFQVVTFIKK